MGRSNTLFAIAAATALFAAPASGAQSGTLTGVVQTIGNTGRPVADVEISLDRLDRATRSDSLGRFRLGDVAVGTYSLRARRIGFESAALRVEVVANGEVPIVVRMRPSAQPMATIRIAGQIVSYPARLAEPYARVARGFGTFFTREQIDSLFPLDLKSLLMRVPGVHVNGGRIEFVRCQVEGHVQVWVDGTRWTSYATRRAEFDVDANQAIRDIVPSSVQLLEIYGGPSRIPAEYLDDACAVILIWRK